MNLPSLIGAILFFIISIKFFIDKKTITLVFFDIYIGFIILVIGLVLLYFTFEKKKDDIGGDLYGYK